MANQYLHCSPKKPNIPFYPQSFSQCQVHLIRKTILPPTACLASFFDRDNSVITLFQFTIICVQVNSKRMNGHTQYKNSLFVLYIITKHNFIYLFYVLSLLFLLSLFIISRDNNQTLPTKKPKNIVDGGASCTW